MSDDNNGGLLVGFVIVSEIETTIIKKDTYKQENKYTLDEIFKNSPHNVGFKPTIDKENPFVSERW